MPRPQDPAKRRDMLEKSAATSLNSKLVSGHKEFFAKMVVDAVLSLDEKAPNLEMIGMKKVQGGALQESVLVEGVAFKKCFSYAGFEQSAHPSVVDRRRSSRVFSLRPC
jgi:T-complex protein 1 subunit eta